VNSLLGRVGIRFAQEWRVADLFGVPHLDTVTGWVRPNLWYEFSGKPEAAFSSASGFIPFEADLFGPTFELNAGFTAEVAQDTAIYANASYLVGVGGSAGGNAYDGKLGIKVGW
jgi:outer membrane autotransporter protein